MPDRDDRAVRTRRSEERACLRAHVEAGVVPHLEGPLPLDSTFDSWAMEGLHQFSLHWCKEMAKRPGGIPL